MILHTSKNPSIFSFTPPIGCTWPNWFIDPVIEIFCLIGILQRADIIANASATDALSPSITPYNCSKLRLKSTGRVLYPPLILLIYPFKILIPLVWILPLRLDSLWASMIFPSPLKQVQVILTGLPKLVYPVSMTESPLICPTLLPETSINNLFSSYNSRYSLSIGSFL